MTDDVTIRDYFAAAALAGLLSAEAGHSHREPFDPTKPSHLAHMAADSYRVADAMLEARKET